MSTRETARHLSRARCRTARTAAAAAPFTLRTRRALSLPETADPKRRRRQSTRVRFRTGSRQASRRRTWRLRRTTPRSPGVCRRRRTRRRAPRASELEPGTVAKQIRRPTIHRSCPTTPRWRSVCKKRRTRRRRRRRGLLHPSAHPRDRLLSGTRLLPLPPRRFVPGARVLFRPSRRTCARRSGSGTARASNAPGAVIASPTARTP